MQGKAGPVRFELEPSMGRQWSNQDFVLSYKAWSRDILCNAVLEPDRDERGLAKKEDGSFVMFIAPPATGSGEIAPRDVVFLIDNSYSMHGSAMRLAKQALQECLKLLAPTDRFSIGVFNHRMQWWNGSQTRYNKAWDEANSGHSGGEGKFFGADKRSAAHQFVGSIETNGGTNIMRPMMSSLDMQQKVQEYVSSQSDAQQRVPVVFLITDGAVGNDKQICSRVKERNDDARRNGQQLTRVFTFGLGAFVNDHFLTSLAQLSRGKAEFALQEESIEPSIVRLMRASSDPALLNIMFKMPSSIREIEFYPYPIPDLYRGQPVVVSGRYTGPHPHEIKVRGTLPGGGIKEITVQPVFSQSVPVRRMFAKAQLDLLMASHWLMPGGSEAAEDQRKKIVSVSKRHEVPCPYTTMIGYTGKTGDIYGKRQA